MKVAPRQSDAFLKSVPPHIRAVLLHGSDNGLMSERAKLMARQHCDDLAFKLFKTIKQIYY